MKVVEKQGGAWRCLREEICLNVGFSSKVV